MARRRGGGTIGDMVRTAAVFGVVVLAVVALKGGSSGRSQVVRVDGELTAQIAVARAAGLAVLAPSGLPAAWAPTSARFSTSSDQVGGRGLLHAGFLTPKGGFATLEETDGDVTGALAPYAGKGLRDAGTVDVRGRAWQRRMSADGTVTLRRRSTAGVDLGLSGGADQGELEQLAGSLR